MKGQNSQQYRKLKGVRLLAAVNVQRARRITSEYCAHKKDTTIHGTFRCIRSLLSRVIFAPAVSRNIRQMGNDQAQQEQF